MTNPDAYIDLKISAPIAEFEIKSSNGINILHTGLLNSFRNAVEKLKDNGHIKAAIVRSGSAGGFAAGADMQELRALDCEQSIVFSSLGQSVFSLIKDIPTLFIAVVDGYCIGGGFDLALACDIIVSSQKAYFQHPGTSRGFITGFGGNFRFSHSAGSRESIRSLILGDRITSGEADTIGLSIRNSESDPDTKKNLEKELIGKDALNSALKIAEELSSLNVQQISLIKSTIRSSRRISLSDRICLESRLSFLYSLHMQKCNQ